MKLIDAEKIEEKERLKIIPVNPASKVEFGIEIQNGVITRTGRFYMDLPVRRRG